MRRAVPRASAEDRGGCFIGPIHVANPRRTTGEQKAPRSRGAFPSRSDASRDSSALGARLCTGAAGLLGLPGLILLEQRLAVGFALQALAGGALLQEVVETVALRAFHG